MTIKHHPNALAALVKKDQRSKRRLRRNQGISKKDLPSLITFYAALLLTILAQFHGASPYPQYYQTSGGSQLSSQMPSSTAGLQVSHISQYDKCLNQPKYRQEGPVGIRYKKQILVTRDMTSGTFDSHMLEAAMRRRHFLYMFDLPMNYEDHSGFYFEEDFQLQQLCPSYLDNFFTDDFTLFSSADGPQEDETEAAKQNSGQDPFCALNDQSKNLLMAPPNTFLQSQYYKPRYSFIQGAFGLKLPADQTIAQGGIQIQIQGNTPGETVNEIAKDNHYLNLALGVKPSYEVPINVVDCLDQEQTIESFLFKKAKSNNIENFEVLRQVLGNDQRLSSLDMFQRYSFTYEDPAFIANLTNGMKPNSIQKLKPQSSIFRYFTQELEITPSKISFDECKLLIPKFEVIKITNKQRTKDVEIKALLASSPELTFYPVGGRDFPITLKPREFLEVKIAYTSETLGLFEALMYLVIDEWIFISSFNAYVVPNDYDLQPIYVTDLNMDQTIELPLYIQNPSQTDTMIVEELFSTEEDVKLKWPHSKEVMSNKICDACLDNHSVVQHILVPEGAKKHIANMLFSINRTLDFNVHIHIKTSLHDIIRLPLYYHVHQDVVKFTPTIIDFGLAPLNFDMIKVPLFAKSKLIETLIIQEIQVPLSDSRIDFQLIELTKNSNQMKRVKDLFLGYVLLNPNAPGIVESKLILQVTGQSSKTNYTIEIPIVGRVHRLQNLLGSQMSTDPTSTFSYPIAAFDLSEHIENLNSSQKRKVNEVPTIKTELLTEPLIIRNNFNVPIQINSVINLNQEFKLNKRLSRDEPVLLYPGDSFHYGDIELSTQKLKITQGNKYLSVNINNTIVPISVAIFDRGLLCVWDDQEGSLNLESVPLCSKQSYELNFDYVAINDAKQRRLKITNINPVEITIESVQKQQLDDLHVFLEKVVDRNGNPVNLAAANIELVDSSTTGSLSIIGPKRTKRVINYRLQPQQTMVFVFQVQAREQKQKFSRVDFVVKNSQSFQFNYKYHAIQGSLIVTPQVLQFNPTQVGIPQSQPLVAVSTFDVPVTVKAIISNDIRFMPQLHPTSIKAHNRTEFGMLTFDPTKQQVNMQNLQQTASAASNALKNLELTNLFNQPILNIDPIVQQNLIQILNELSQGGGANVGGQPQFAMLQLPKNANIPSISQLQALLTPQDLETFRDRRKIIEQQSLQMGEITSHITIETNVYINISIPVRPTTSKKNGNSTQTAEGLHVDPIDFDTVQIGTQSFRSIRIVNPTDEPIQVSLYLASTEVDNNLKNLGKSDLGESFKANGEKKVPSPNDKDYFYQLYCSGKIKEERQFGKVRNFNKVSLSQKENQKILCFKVSKILGSIDQAEDLPNEDIDVIRRRIESYFKDAYFAEVQNELANQQQKHQNILKTSPGLPQKGVRSSLEQVMSSQPQHPYGHINFGGQGGSGTQWVSFDQLLENLTNAMNEFTQSRPVDEETLNILKQTHDSQQDYISGVQNSGNKAWGWLDTITSFPLSNVFETSYMIFKTLLVGRHPLPRQTNSTLLKNDKVKSRELREQPREVKPLNFRLKNAIMHDIIINNDTSKLFPGKIIITDPFIKTYTGQNFFINPQYVGVNFKIDPRSNLTVRDAIVFQPQTLHNEHLEMKLVLKNNMTLLQTFDIKGKSGTGLLEISKVLKRAHFTNIPTPAEAYVNAHTLSGHIYGMHASQNDIEYQNLTSTSLLNQQLVRERIMGNIFGQKEKESQREVIIRNGYNRYASSSSGNTNFGFNLHGDLDPNIIPFHIAHEDIFVPASSLVKDKQETTIDQMEGGSDFSTGYEYEFIEDHESVLVNRILERNSVQHNLQEIYSKHKKNQIRIQSYHKRALVIQNTGNLPLSLESISLDDKGCKSQNFVVENCDPFTLQPGDTHWVHIGFTTDFTIAKLKKKLSITTKEGIVQDFTLEVQLPLEYLQAANELVPLTGFEEWRTISLKLVLLLIAFTSFTLVAKDVYCHLRFSKQLIPIHEERANSIDDGSHLSASQSRSLQRGSQPAQSMFERKEFIPPVLKECITNDNVFQLYFQAQDKLSDKSGGIGAGRNQQNQLLLLKEVSNICSNKRNLVCLEAQKQAIDAEKEQRRVQQMRNISYQQQLTREKELIKQAAAAAITVKSNPPPGPLQVVSEFTTEAAELQHKRAQEIQKIDSGMNSAGFQTLIQTSAPEKPVLKKVPLVQQQPQKVTLESKDNSIVVSEASDSLGLNGSSTTVKEDSKIIDDKTVDGKAAKGQIQQQKMTKKQKQRLKEVQEAEERFKLQQVEKAKREKEEAILREAQRIENERKAEQRRLREERERLEELKRQEQMKKAEEIEMEEQRKLQEINKRGIIRSKELKIASPSENQSMVIEDRGDQSPLNIFDISNPPTTTSQNVVQKKSRFDFEGSQKSLDKKKQIGGLSQIDRKESQDLHQADEHQIDVEMESEILYHLGHFKDRKSQKSQSRPHLFERAVLDNNKSQEILQESIGSKQEKSKVTIDDVESQENETEGKNEPSQDKSESQLDEIKDAEVNQRITPDVPQRKIEEKQLPVEHRQKQGVQGTLAQNQERQATQAVNSLQIFNSIQGGTIKRTVIDRSKDPSFQVAVKAEQEQKYKPKQPQVIEREAQVLTENKKGLLLTQDDLQPFFKAQEQRNMQNNLIKTQNQEVNKSKASSPNPNNAGGYSSSIFLYNPLSIFSGAAATIDNKGDSPSAKKYYEESQLTSHDVTPFGNEEEEEEVSPEDKQEDQDVEEDSSLQEQQQPSTSLYSAFKSTSQIFSRPLFGNTNTMKMRYSNNPVATAAGTSVPLYSASHHVNRGGSADDFDEDEKITETIEQSIMKKPAHFANNENDDAIGFSIYQSMEQEEEDEEDDKSKADDDKDAGSLFSGSLFGKQSIFGESKEFKPQSSFTQNQLSGSVFQQEPQNNRLTPQKPPNPWQQSSIPSSNYFTQGQKEDFLSQDAYFQHSAALRRNQQSLYQTGSTQRIPGAPSSTYGGGSQFYPNYMQPIQPPPGLGYRPQQQNQTLYSQYSQGGMHSQQTGSGVQYQGYGMNRPPQQHQAHYPIHHSHSGSGGSLSSLMNPNSAPSVQGYNQQQAYFKESSQPYGTRQGGGAQMSSFFDKQKQQQSVHHHMPPHQQQSNPWFQKPIGSGLNFSVGSSSDKEGGGAGGLSTLGAGRPSGNKSEESKK